MFSEAAPPRFPTTFRTAPLHRPYRESSGGALAARRRAVRTSHRPALGGLPQSLEPGGRGRALCRVLPALRHGANPQQRRRQHENGSVEAAHGHLKSGLGEALELRGSRDFPDLAAYQAFLQEFIARKNAPRRAVLAIELAALLPLPRHRTTDFSTATVTVTRSATISVRTVLYTVPSRLIGCRLKVHIYDDRLVCYLGTTPVLTVGRRHFKRHGPRLRVVDYRHLIGSLVKKPQAFRHSVFHDELF